MNPREYEALFRTEDRHWWFAALRREIARALERHPAGRPGASLRWLDAGSGTGGLLAHLDLRREAMRVGVDESLDALLLARPRRLRVTAGSVTSLPFPAESFDLVTSIDVLCHRNVEKLPALAEARRCLRGGGILLLQVPAFDWLASEHDRAVWTDRRFRRREVEALVNEAGLAVRESFYRVGVLFPVAAFSRLAKRRQGPERDARSQVRPAAPLANLLFGGLLRFEAATAAAGLRLPFGLSVFCVAQKKP
ncbi:MAG TPA: class I SAM-dependent methyltransferase [Thermoanaerobaculia bacterium]|nr:class I SAM-dependent methyltransferase [Thermoanaerobaculia bacterium]